jgi:hypothetical protein
MDLTPRTGPQPELWYQSIEKPVLWASPALAGIFVFVGSSQPAGSDRKERKEEGKPRCKLRESARPH